MSSALAAIEQEVLKLHANSADACMREWFFSGHVQVVADYAHRIAEREKVDSTVPVLASLLHDIARTAEVDDEPELSAESERMAKEIMARHGFDTPTIAHVTHIMAIHSCRGTTPPDTPEAKIMTTADAMAHLMTDFYFILPFRGWLTAADNFTGYKNWLLEKTERDTFKKIQFEPERALALPRYHAFKILFS